MRSERLLPWWLIVAGSIGLLASAILMVERVRLLEDPLYTPMCSLNAVFSCGSVMTSSQASVFGFPNPLLGIAGFAMVLAIGLGLVAGASYRPWFWWGLQGGVTFAIGFVHWLIFQTVFRIEALCPYCMVVWVVSWPLFLYVSLRNMQLSPGISDSALGARLRQYHSSILMTWYVVLAVVILWRFWG